jgi:acetylornithine deacetylase
MEVSGEIERRVIKEVERRLDDTVSYLRDLVREPSVLGNEAGAQEVVLARMKKLGLDAEKWDLDLDTLRGHPVFGPLDRKYENRPNVTAIWPASKPGGRSLILNGHIDVVSPEPITNWSCDPWGGQVDGDWLYGRGSGDMKAGIASYLLAVESVRAVGMGLRGNLILESVIEEECTGNGTLACGLRGIRADAAIIPEPHHLEASLSTMAVVWFRVRTSGKASHVSAADQAVNAIEELYGIIAALRRLEKEMNAQIRHPFYRDFPHPVNLNIGVIRGGDWPSTVPSSCEMECRLSGEPGMSVAEIHSRVSKAVVAAAESDPWLREHPPVVEFFGFRAEASVTDPRSAPMKVLEDCHKSILGQPMVFRAGTATTDQRFFLNEWGIPATSYGPTAENIHAVNERVLIPSIAQVAKVLALFILRWCGVDL